MRVVLFIFLITPLMIFSQDPREFNHGNAIVEFENEGVVKYYLTWSSAFANAWEHDIYNATIFFDTNGSIITETQDQLYIGTGFDEAQEPVDTTINPFNNHILSVWEDGSGTDAPNVRAQLHYPDGTVIKNNWVISGGIGAQHSANASHLGNHYLIFYADEAPPSIGGAVLKAKVIDHIDGNETQTISFTSNYEDHWWPVSISNSDHSRVLIIWGNDGYATRGTVLYENEGTIQPIISPQDYLINTQQYYYQVEWLENISRFLLIARNGAYDNITDESQVCLIDSFGNITNTKLVNGGILREAKMAVKWSECNQIYNVFFPSGVNGLTQIQVESDDHISSSFQIVNHPDLINYQWLSTGISASFINDITGNDVFSDAYVALFIMPDLLSNNSVKIAVNLNTSLFCSSLSANENQDTIKWAYPNPSASKIYFPYNLLNSEYEVFSTSGQLVLKGILFEREINISILNEGLYLMKLKKQEDDEIHLFKIIKKN